MGEQTRRSIPKEKQLELRADGLVGIVWNKGLDKGPPDMGMASVCWMLLRGYLMIMCQRVYQSTFPKLLVKKIIIIYSVDKKIFRNMKSKNPKLYPKASAC